MKSKYMYNGLSKLTIQDMQLKGWRRCEDGSMRIERNRLDQGMGGFGTYCTSRVLVCTAIG